MWAAASSDLLVFLFGMAAWVCWMKWMKDGRSTWYATAIISFLLALASKESASAFPLLMLIPTLADRRTGARELKANAPFFVLTAAYIARTWLSRVAKPGYNDIRFSLSVVWPVVISEQLLAPRVSLGHSRRRCAVVARRTRWELQNLDRVLVDGGRNRPVQLSV